MKNVIFIVEDEKEIRDIEKKFLQNEGYEVYDFATVKETKEKMEALLPDIFVLDIMLNGEDGLTFLSYIKSNYGIPVIIVSAKDKPIDRVNGLNIGCDEYIIKPFLPIELGMHIKKLLKTKIRVDDKNEYKISNLTLLIKERQIFIDKNQIRMSPNAFDFLMLLLKNEGSAVKEEELLREVWNIKSTDINTRMCDDLVKRIRKKLVDNNAKVEIENIWGYGFRIKKKNEKN